jgi:hypothetical protein
VVLAEGACAWGDQDAYGRRHGNLDGVPVGAADVRKQALRAARGGMHAGRQAGPQREAMCMVRSWICDELGGTLSWGQPGRGGRCTHHRLCASPVLLSPR